MMNRQGAKSAKDGEKILIMISWRPWRLGGFSVWLIALAACAPAPEPNAASSRAASAGPRVLGHRAPATTSTAVRPTSATAKAADGAAEPAGAAPRAPTSEELARYGWLAPDARIRTLAETIAPPTGFQRTALAPDSFGAYLRGLPLRAAGSPVNAYDGSVLHEGDDRRVAAVAEIDVSPVDLQQCADSVIRWHAEWQWSRGEKATIGYHFLSGDFARYQDYAGGLRPAVDGPRVTWKQSAKQRDDRPTFRKYLDLVFTYASTISLAQRNLELSHDDVRPGDFFVLPGGPGHAILILDVATDASGRRVALLGQGYMPAQDFHVIRPIRGERAFDPWFSLEGDDVDTPFWPSPFPWSSLRRMR